MKEREMNEKTKTKESKEGMRERRAVKMRLERKKRNTNTVEESSEEARMAKKDRKGEKKRKILTINRYKNVRRKKRRKGT